MVKFCFEILLKVNFRNFIKQLSFSEYKVLYIFLRSTIFNRSVLLSFNIFSLFLLHPDSTNFVPVIISRLALTRTKLGSNDPTNKHLLIFYIFF